MICRPTLTPFQVWIEPAAIPRLVYSKIIHPEALTIASNLINSAELGWLHYHIGAVHTYLPELEPPGNSTSFHLTDEDNFGPKTWRPSKLPTWQGADDYAFPVEERKDILKPLKIGEPGGPPFKNHRWLPLRDDDKSIHRTPVHLSRYHPHSLDWQNWAIAAQVHYSFLENLEAGSLSKYHLGQGTVNSDEMEGIWNMAYERMNINLLAIWGDDVLDNAPFSEQDDEHFLSITLPKRLGRTLLVNTHALAAHFSFQTQHELFETDLLGRYRALAAEMVCEEKVWTEVP